MWKVDLPPRGDVNAQLNSGLVHKDGTAAYALSDVERAAIAALYDAYDAALGEPNPALNPPELDACRDALHNAYSQVQKGARLSSMRGALLAAVIECPLCGAEAATTLDHHLPKDDYRALSINPRNLVPSCQPCNRAKGTLTPVAGEGMIHAYYQEIPEITFLQAKADYVSGKLVVKFHVNKDLLQANLGDRLHFQLERLKLNERYFGPINIFMFNLKPSLLMLRAKDDPAGSIKEFFLQSATIYDGDFKLNHWKAALLRGLAACDAFLANPWMYLDQPLPKVEVLVN